MSQKRTHLHYRNAARKSELTGQPKHAVTRRGQTQKIKIGAAHRGQTQKILVNGRDIHTIGENGQITVFSPPDDAKTISRFLEIMRASRDRIKGEFGAALDDIAVRELSEMGVI